MENAVKALEYAFAILVFVIALSTSMYLLSEVKTTSDIAFSEIDTKRFYEDAELPPDEVETNGSIKYNGRIVNVETIVPTLYRDYKENYIIEFYDTSGNNIIKFDLSEENRTRQIWTGNPDVDIKKRLDLFLNGSTTGKGIINNQEHDLNNDIAFVKKESIAGLESYVMSTEDKKTVVTQGFYNYCKGKKFSEEYAYVPELSEQSLEEGLTRIVIRYKEVQ